MWVENAVEYGPAQREVGWRTLCLAGMIFRAWKGSAGFVRSGHYLINFHPEQFFGGDSMHSMASATSPLAELKDSDLFREACFIDGTWMLADSGKTISVDNPASG